MDGLSSRTPEPLEAALESHAALVSVSFGRFEEPLQRLKAARKRVTIPGRQPRELPTDPVARRDDRFATNLFAPSTGEHPEADRLAIEDNLVA